MAKFARERCQEKGVKLELVKFQPTVTQLEFGRSLVNEMRQNTNVIAPLSRAMTRDTMIFSVLMKVKMPYNARNTYDFCYDRYVTSCCRIVFESLHIARIYSLLTDTVMPPNNDS